MKPLAEEPEQALDSVHARLENLAKQEARQRALLAALHEPILAASTDGCVTDFNPAAVALLGGAARIYGHPIEELLPCVAAPTPSATQHAMWVGQVTDSTGYVLDVEVSQIRLAEGPLPACDVYVIHDVSRYAETSRAREQLLYNVAHELRGPLMVLDNIFEILSTEYDELSVAEFERLVRLSRQTARRLRSLMDDLLSAGSIQAGRFLVQPAPVPLSAIVAEAIEMVEAVVESRGQRVACELPDGHLKVLADQRYACQVLSNLLTNASKYSAARGVIRVRAERVQDYVRIAVEDRGPGIPAEQRAELFVRFYRARSRNEAPGVGLGLAISRGIVRAHGGSMGVESETGVGTTVWFTLPVDEGTDR